MKVKDLIAHLQLHDPDDLVVLSIDAEGNAYTLMDSYITKMAWETKDYNRGDVWIRELTPELIAQGFDPEEVAPENTLPCVVFYPY